MLNESLMKAKRQLRLRFLSFVRARKNFSGGNTRTFNAIFMETRQPSFILPPVSRLRGF